MGSSRPGKFPARVLSVKNGMVTLKGEPEDVNYLKPFVDKVVTVEITPTSSASGEPPVGGEPDEGPSKAVSDS